MKIANELECPECLGSGIYTCRITGGSDLCENCGGIGKITPAAPQPGGGGEAEDKPTNVSEEVYQRAQQGLDAAHERISATPPIALPVRAEEAESELMRDIQSYAHPSSFSRDDYAQMHKSVIARVAALSRELEESRAKFEKLQQTKRPFSDALAQKVIDGQVKELDRLRAELTTLRAAPRSEGTVSEADIEKAARFFANAYIRGFRGASSLAKATPVEAWVDENWESFCTEATEFLATLAPRSETEGRDKALREALDDIHEQAKVAIMRIDAKEENVPLRAILKLIQLDAAAALAHDEKGAGE